jgi:hypothetical protein
VVNSWPRHKLDCQPAHKTCNPREPNNNCALTGVNILEHVVAEHHAISGAPLPVMFG